MIIVSPAASPTSSERPTRSSLLSHRYTNGSFADRRGSYATASGLIATTILVDVGISHETARFRGNLCGPLFAAQIRKQRIARRGCSNRRWRHADVDQFCLSPQCGFASTEEGNILTEDQQWRKLGMIVALAGEVWNS